MIIFDVFYTQNWDKFNEIKSLESDCAKVSRDKNLCKKWIRLAVMMHVIMAVFVSEYFVGMCSMYVILY